MTLKLLLHLLCDLTCSKSLYKALAQCPEELLWVFLDACMLTSVGR